MKNDCHINYLFQNEIYCEFTFYEFPTSNDNYDYNISYHNYNDNQIKRPVESSNSKSNSSLFSIIFIMTVIKVLIVHPLHCKMSKQNIQELRLMMTQEQINEERDITPRNRQEDRESSIIKIYRKNKIRKS
jgi:hypothetical protein